MTTQPQTPKEKIVVVKINNGKVGVSMTCLNNRLGYYIKKFSGGK